MSEALTGNLQPRRQIVDRKGRPVSYEGAIVKLFTGLAFLVVSIALAFSGTGRGWWFWMLIPAFTSLGAGVAQYVQLRNSGPSTGARTVEGVGTAGLGEAPTNAALPPTQTQYVSPASSRYKTGDLVPPSVTDGTTRHLEMDKEGETMTLPKI